MLKKTFICLFPILFSSISVFAQSTFIPSYSVESGLTISGGKHAPFWFYSNQYGKISQKNNSVYLLPSIFKKLNDSSHLDYSYNFSPLLRYDGLGRSYMHQWYAELKFYFINFTAGAKEESFGNQDSSLSSGCIIWSHNARPMPKLTFYVPQYTPVPFTWKYLEFKGGLSHGWLGDNEYNKNVWLHHKYFYLRLGGKLPVHVSYGLHHFAQWGGTYNNVKLPHNLEAFKDVFLGRGGNSSDSNTPWAEWANKLGNHLGSRNFGMEVSLKKYNISLYWQNYFEDGSGKAYRNIKDGLFGISIHTKDKHKLISGFVYEFLNTTDQSGRYNLKPGDDSGTEYGGNDDYFNNGIYQQGWSYQNMTIGNPLITSPAIMHGDNYDYIRNNRVMAHHIGMEGIVYSIKYKLLYTYSLNYGTNYYPISPEQTQHSIYLNTEIADKLPWNIILTSSIGADFGKLYGNNFGVMFSLKKLIGL
jgi:hypothetical protein